MQAAHAASGAEVVTVAIRRIHLDDPTGKTLIDHLDRTKYTLLPNTAGCFTAKDAVLTAKLAREALGTDLIKVEVIGDPDTLYPDTTETIAACEELVRLASRCCPTSSTIRSRASGSKRSAARRSCRWRRRSAAASGVCNPYSIAIIKERAKIPVIVDAGVGTASDAAIAMELGVDGLLMNTGIAAAGDPERMALAMRDAVSAGRNAFLAGRMPKRLYASASSPMSDLIATPVRA